MKITYIFREDRPTSPYGMRWYVDRKAKHLFFEDKDSRDRKRDELKKQVENEGKQSTKLKTSEVLDYIRAKKLLKPLGISVQEAVKRYLKTRGQDQSEQPLSKSLKEYLKAQENLVSPAHHRQLKKALSNFEGNFARRTLSIKPAEIRDWLNGLPFEAQTKQNYRKRVSSFYNFAVKQEWIGSNPVAAVSNPVAIPKEIGVLTPEEASYLFRANLDSPPAVLARLALEAFAGLRYSSAVRLSFTDIKWENRGIELPAAKMKTKRRHYIDGLPDNLWEWLDFCREQSTDWKIAERNYLYHKSAAWNKATQLYREEHDGEGVVPHPKNALRHSFASYHVALNKSPSKTATILCHNSEKKLWNHYKGKATEIEGKQYFEIQPQFIAR